MNGGKFEINAIKSNLINMMRKDLFSNFFVRFIEKIVKILQTKNFLDKDDNLMFLNTQDQEDIRKKQQDIKDLKNKLKS